MKKEYSVDLLYWNNQHSGPCKSAAESGDKTLSTWYCKKKRLLTSYCEILKILKMKFFSSLMLKIFSSHLTWKFSWTPSHKIMVSIISMNANKTELPATKGFTMVHCRLWNMVHGSNLNWNRCIFQNLGNNSEIKHNPPWINK